VADGELVGTNINKVEGTKVYPNKLDKLTPRAEVYRNFDADFARQLARSTAKRTLNITATVRFEENGVALRYDDARGISAEVRADGEFDAPKNVERMRAILTEQVCKSGDTVFVVTDVAIEGEIRFVASSMLASMRREALEQLTQRAMMRTLPRRTASEDTEVRVPWRVVDGSKNVTNRVSRRFYEEHGAERIEQGWDLADNLYDKPVMTSRYCLRREIGDCLREKPKYRGALYLERGATRYRLDFDCRRCEMRLIAEDICKD
jgi:putative protease